MLDLANFDALAGNPVVSASCEGLVIENLLAAAPDRTQAGFYRTSAGAEIDLVLDLPQGQRWAIEIKRGQTPKTQKGFHHAREDIEPDRTFVVYSGKERYPKAEGIEVIGLRELASELAAEAI